ncbi:MAG: sigma-70 family RNA polymerase sigma factor [Pseudomonadota bacterium]
MTYLGQELTDQLTRFVHRRVSAREDAEDLVQDILIKVFTSEGPKDEEKFPQWLFVIARNKVIDHYRRQEKSPKTAAVELDELASKGTASAEDQTSLCIGLKELMKNLSPEDQHALEAVDLGGMSQKDYAKQENMSYPTAKSRVQRARKRLKRALEDCCRIELDRRGKPIACISKSDQQSCYRAPNP